MNVCFILVSAPLRHRSFLFFFSLFVRGIDEKWRREETLLPPVPISAFTSSPLIVRGYSSFDPLKLHPGGHRHKELWGKVVLMVGGELLILAVEALLTQREKDTELFSDP